ncbi:MAG TPA: DUF350 domain-containing protein [Lysobacter sp.]
MPAAPITAQTFMNFLAYFGTGLGVLVAAAVLVSLVTPHREFTLIRAGNASAATAYAGTLVGLALPLHAAITHSVSLLDALIWGAVASVVQLLAYVIARAALPRISQEITDNVIAGGIFAAGVSISVGLINAAAMTP